VIGRSTMPMGMGRSTQPFAHSRVELPGQGADCAASAAAAPSPAATEGHGQEAVGVHDPPGSTIQAADTDRSTPPAHAGLAEGNLATALARGRETIANQRPAARHASKACSGILGAADPRGPTIRSDDPNETTTGREPESRGLPVLRTTHVLRPPRWAVRRPQPAAAPRSDPNRARQS